MVSFPSVLARLPASSPSRPSERTRETAQKAETRDDGPTGPATSTSPRPTDGGLYTDFGAKARKSERSVRRLLHQVDLDQARSRRHHLAAVPANGSRCGHC